MVSWCRQTQPDPALHFLLQFISFKMLCWRCSAVSALITTGKSIKTVQVCALYSVALVRVWGAVCALCRCKGWERLGGGAGLTRPPINIVTFITFITPTPVPCLKTRQPRTPHTDHTNPALAISAGLFQSIRRSSESQNAL